MKKILWSFLGAFLFLGMPFWAGAQEEDVPPIVEGDIAEMINKDEYDIGGDNNLTLIAQVELYDAEILSQENNSFKLVFRLVNEGDIQPQIKYAIVLTDENGLLIHQHHYNEMITLGAGQELKKEVEYEAPLGINGKYNLNIVVANLKGLTLALGGFGEVNIEGEGLIVFQECYIQIGEEKFSINSGVDIDAGNEKPVLRCEVFNESAGDIIARGIVEIRERSMFGNEIKKEELGEQVFKAKEKSSLIYNLFLPDRPQAYDGELVLKSGDNIVSLSVPLHYVIRGDSATIQNISLDKNDYESGDTIKINLMIAGDADDFPEAREESREGQDSKLFADVAVYNGDNQKCAPEKTFEVDELKPINVLELKTDVRCNDPNISLKLRNSEGKILDENDFDLKTINEDSDSVGIIKDLTNNSLVRLFFALGFILVIITIISVFLKNKRSSYNISIFLILLGAIFFLGGDNVEAAVYSGSTVNNGGVEPYTITYSLSSDSINQGGSITAYSRLSWYGCLNATRHTVSSFRLDAGPTWYSYTSNVNQNTHDWAWRDYGLKSHTFSSLNTVGTHNIYFRVTGRRYYYSGYDNQKDSNGKYVCLRCDQNTSYQAITPNAGSCACYDHLFTRDLSLGFNVIQRVNGACNYLRAKAYTAFETNWAGGNWCTSAPGGITNQPSSFLGYGGSATWYCLGSGGGANASCTASRGHLVATCGTRATTYPASATNFPALTATSWCSLGTAEGVGSITFPPDGTSTPYWICRGSNSSSTADDKINICRASSALSPVVNGACNPSQAKEYTPLQTTWADGTNWCSQGTVSVAPASFPGYGKSTSWICNGNSNGTNSPPCVAKRKYDYPDVDFSLAPPTPYVLSYDADANIFNPQSITLTTKIDNFADACGVMGCNCKIEKDGSLFSNFKIDTSADPRNNTIDQILCGNFNYKVTCFNADGLSDEGTVGTGLVSSAPGTSVGTCKKVCGDETYEIKEIKNDCSTLILSSENCNNPKCPAVGQPIEVR